MNHISEMQRLHGELEQLSGWATGAADRLNNHMLDVRKMVDELATVKESLRVAEDEIAGALEIATWKPSVMSSSEDNATVYAGRLNDIRRILEGDDG